MIEGASESSKAVAREGIEQAIQLSIRISTLLYVVLDVLNTYPDTSSSQIVLLEDILKNQARIRSRLQYLGRLL